MNDEQKEQFKQNLIALMESVGNGTFKPEPKSKAKLYVRKFLRWLASPIAYFVRLYKYRKAKRQLEQVCQDVMASQIDTMRKGVEFLEALPEYKPRYSFLPWQQPFKGYNVLVSYRSRKYRQRINKWNNRNQ